MSSIVQSAHEKRVDGPCSVSVCQESSFCSSMPCISSSERWNLMLLETKSCFSVFFGRDLSGSVLIFVESTTPLFSE